MKRLLKYIFIPIFAVLMMSHNVGAITTSLNFSDINVISVSVTPPMYCDINSTAATITYGWCYNDSFGVNKVNSIYTTESFKVNKNNYIEFDLVISSSVNFPDGGGYSIEEANLPVPTGMRLISRYQVADTTLYKDLSGNTSGGDGNYFYHAYHYIYKYINDDTNVQIGLVQRSVQRGLINYYNDGLGRMSFKIANLVVYEGVTHDVNKEQKEAADSAISDSESSSEENSSNAKTTNLIGALSGIFTTISSTSATNCNITGDLGAINMGSLNLCQGKEHFNSLIEFIGFSGLFVVVFWASYHLVKRTLGLIDWARSN